MANNKDIITSIIWTLIFVGTQIVSSILGIMIISIIYESKVKDISEIVSSNLMLFAILGNIIFIGISFYVFKLFKKKKFLNEPKVSISQFALPLLTILFFSLTWNIVQQNHLSSEYALGDVLNQTMQNNAILFILAVYVLAPIAEEIAFRGIIMRKLQEKRWIHSCNDRKFSHSIVCVCRWNDILAMLPKNGFLVFNNSSTYAW